MLQTVMKLPQFARFIQTDHVSGSEIMTDICDGTYIKSHPLTIQGDIFLQFVISYNDLELQNPLRSNKKHKLAMVYFTLLNIPPQYWSQLNNIFLLGLARTKDVKHFGFDWLLHDFLTTVKLLRDEGLYMTLNGPEEKNLR